MSDELNNPSKCAGLPKEFIDRLRMPFAHFLKIEAAAGAVLLFFTVTALVMANSPWAHAFLSFWEMPVGIQIDQLNFERSLRD